jgi:streptomycin 6-kinase
VTRVPANLAAILADLSDRWELEIFPAYHPGGKCAWVAPARRRGVEDVVVKIGWPHPEADHEADGLALWAGDGAVRLLDATTVEALPVMLLEQCLPGTYLSTLADPDEQDVVVAGLLRRLWREPPAGHVFRPLEQMCAKWADGAHARLVAASGVDARLVRTGLDLFRSLPASAPREDVLVTDLHAENILSAQREPWLAIDPKPYVGDPTYDALQHMLNVPRLMTDPDGLVQRMAALLDLDADRLRLWLFARCCIEAVEDPDLADVAARLRP